MLHPYETTSLSYQGFPKESKTAYCSEWTVRSNWGDIQAGVCPRVQA